MKRAENPALPHEDLQDLEFKSALSFRCFPSCVNMGVDEESHFTDFY